MVGLPVLETARLILRPWSLDDLDATVAMDSDPAVMRFIHPVEDPEEHRAWARQRLTAGFGPGLGFWSVFAKDDPARFLGFMILKRLPGHELVEIGWRLVRDAWGKGFASEAALALRDHGFGSLGLPQIVAVAHPDNLASHRVMAKIGLVRTGTITAYDQTLPIWRMKRPPGA